MLGIIIDIHDCNGDIFLMGILQCSEPAHLPTDQGGKDLGYYLLCSLKKRDEHLE